MATTEAELKTLMVASLTGDAAAHRMLLDRLSGHLRAYFKGRLARIRRSATEAEDLVQPYPAGAVSATGYALHCVDDSLPFVALWYGGTIAICTLAGALVGPRLRRW
jgi:hypothetical protein